MAKNGRVEEKRQRLSCQGEAHDFSVVQMHGLAKGMKGRYLPTLMTLEAPPLRVLRTTPAVVLAGVSATESVARPIIYNNCNV